MATERQGPGAGEQIVQEYLTQVERLPDGSVCTTLYGNGRRLQGELVDNPRHGKRRAYDLLCTAIDTDSPADANADPSVGSAGPPPGCPPAGSDPTPGAGSSGSANAAGAFSAGAVAEAVRAAVTAQSLDAALHMMIRMTLQSGPWDTASISVLGPGGTMQPAACSDAIAADADRLQWQTGEGPCLDAVHPEPHGPGPEQPVAAADLATEHRWPRWAPAATELGIRTVAALRLFTDHTVGSLSLYAQHPKALDRNTMDNAQIVAALTSAVLAQVCNERDLWRAVHSRGVIGQAQGMLMQRYGLTAESAFAVLRRYSQQHNTKLVVLAEQIITTGELPKSTY